MNPLQLSSFLQLEIEVLTTEKIRDCELNFTQDEATNASTNLREINFALSIDGNVLSTDMTDSVHDKCHVTMDSQGREVAKVTVDVVREVTVLGLEAVGTTFHLQGFAPMLNQRT